LIIQNTRTKECVLSIILCNLNEVTLTTAVTIEYHMTGPSIT